MMTQLKNKKRIGILRGGVGEEYESSLREGGNIVVHIHETLSDKYKPVDILIDKNGVWHAQGIRIMPADLPHKVDIVWNISHPSFSSVLENFSIPQISISHFSNTLSKSKTMLEKHMKSIGVKMPRHIVLPLYQEDFDGPRDRYAIRKAKEVHQKFSAPWIIKPFTRDSDMAVHVAKTFPELVEAIYDGVLHKVSILVEELIAGKNTSVHSVAGFRGQEIYVFPLVEKVPTSTRVGTPTENVGEKLINLAKDLHNHLGAGHYLKSDFVLHPRLGIYLIGVSFSPDLKKGSHFDLACQSVGAKMHHVVEHILEKAIAKI